jgi:pimeloyl-ACP methyl ester carboxylesterase
MIEQRTITTGPSLTFDVLTAGPSNAPLVLLLHGFAESFHTWRSQVAALAAAGYRAVAPHQRGYSPGARPDTTDASNYEFDELIGDVMDIAAASGQADRRFHLVGHDWGGSIAWGIADRAPERLASLTVLSRPHPNAFNRALQMPDGEQAQRSRHHRWFLEPDAAPGAPMTEQRTITTGPGLAFDVLTAGPLDGPLVLLLHGFAESFHTWRSQVAALAAAGYRAVAPHQRG